ncbi:acyltransferase family-domain-containing protein [Xylaria bambusicola]|uniref:acyltransferase family-domain-containing protein n=1 Tax=Xylaria bambusicola TaxID=326684 RepID=UPI002008A918|nr:acyltransferase family-domain-containing protein [Xylaria bambusicola]KAI0506882.1 acyltransferase family-domain-containing protein [Xylaria bambusicola]
MAFHMVQQLWTRKADGVAGYHLLENEEDFFEKGEQQEVGGSLLASEAHVPSANHQTHKRQVSSLRWPRMLKILLPSFLCSLTSAIEVKKQRPTAWLDGLRGVAALFVVLHHMSLIWFSWDIHNGWGSWNDHLIQLPIIRLVVSGPANVMLFFVISGYALSWKPLNLIQNSEHVKMYQSLASSIFRRHSRLFIPAIIICAPAPIIAYLGGYSDEGMPGAAIKPMNPPRFDSIWGQFAHYMASIMPLSDLYGPGLVAWIYSDSLWTLPMEFKSSLVVFGLLLALSKCTMRSRIVITLCVAFYSFWYFHWGEFLFVGGMLAVEVNLWSRRSATKKAPILDEGAYDAATMETSLRPEGLQYSVCRQLFYTTAFLIGLFVLSMPEHRRHASDSHGYQMLSQLIPSRFHNSGAIDYFWQPLAAIFLVLVIDSARFLQAIFTTRLAQYLGRVSFALYLVHMLILHSLGFWLGKYFLGITGSNSPWRYGIGISLAASIVGFVIIWAADLGSRFVDVNAVRFTVWAYRRLCKKV